MSSTPNASTRKAIIVGSGGQDGRYLSALLTNKGYQTLGITRHGLDITDKLSVHDLLKTERPHEVYLLAAHHHSSESSFESDDLLFEKSQAVHTTATVHFLEGIARHSSNSRLFFASSSHIYRHAGMNLIDETTPPSPGNIYAITKYSGMLACRYYRETRGVFASCGVLFNHESNLRSAHFLSRKVAIAAARFSQGMQSSLELGNLDAIVDWGFAPDYVDAMYRILQADAPNDYIVATGVPHTVKELVEIAFNSVGLDYREYVRLRSGLLTKNVETRLGNASRLRLETGWEPSVTFEQMIRSMVQHELDAA